MSSTSTLTVTIPHGVYEACENVTLYFGEVVGGATRSIPAGQQFFPQGRTTPSSGQGSVHRETASAHEPSLPADVDRVGEGNMRRTRRTVALSNLMVVAGP